MSLIKIDYKALGRICLAEEKRLIPEGEYFFKDNGSKILAVAHCDYVSNGKIEYFDYDYKGQHNVLCESLDDRLGVYLITELLPQLGINVDVLLTTDEEIGASTASMFDPPAGKDYNWMFSFDRRGTDIVAYEYDTADFAALVKKATNQKLAYGSFSDIVYLTHLGIKGINFGCGYYDEHTQYCGATGRDIARGVSNFLQFYTKYKNKKLPHIEGTPRRSYAGGRVYQWYKDDECFPRGVTGNAYAWEDEEDDTGKNMYGTRISGSCDSCEADGVNLTYDRVLDGYLCDDCLTEMYLDPSSHISEMRCQCCEAWYPAKEMSYHKIQSTKRSGLWTCPYCVEYIESIADDAFELERVGLLQED